MAEPQAPAGNIASRYERFAPMRQPYIDRGRECSALTIPSVLPPEGHRTAKLKDPYQGVGARGVKNLTAKLLLGVFPSNIPFIRLAIDEFQLVELTKNPEAKGEVEKALAKYERAVMLEVETSGIRVALAEVLRHLIVVGNVLLYRDPTSGKGRAIPLTHYVVSRDPLGNVLEVIVREEIAIVLLPQEDQDAINATRDGQADDFETVRLYTRIERKARRWDVSQEAGGHPIQSASGSYPLDQCPWVPLRLTPMDCEDYGRGYVEEHLGDLKSLEKLQKAIVQFAAASAKVVFGRKPNATTNLKKLNAAESGDFVEGDLEKDITVLQLDKGGDFQVTKAAADAIEERLAYCFLLNSALQRNGERVTAEEIRRLAQELDTSLGGVHALLSQELQLPLAKLIMAAKTRRRELPTLPKGFVKPLVVTGVEALGRGTDYDNLMTAVQAIAVVPNAVARLKGDEFGTRIFAALQVDSDGLFMTDEEVQAQQAQQAMAQIATAAAPNAVKAATEAPTQ